MEPIPYGKHFIDEDDIAAVIQALKSNMITQGAAIKEFETVVKDYHKSKYAVAFANGTAALHSAYYALNIKAGDEFITSPNTFVASANAGLYVGAIPKFVDIEEITYNMDISLLETAITEKTKIVTAVSYGGFPIDVAAIAKITKPLGIKIIHDAAHAIGALRNNNTICEFSDVSILSFHPVKHVTTAEGGMALTNDFHIYQKLLAFRAHGIIKDAEELEENHGGWYYEMQSLGYNYRISDIQCALGISQMKKLDLSLYKRNQIAQRYDEALSKLGWLMTPKYPFDKSFLNTQPDLVIKPQDLNAYHLYPVLLKDENKRPHFYNYLRDHHILVQVHYIPVHLMPYYKKNYGYRKGDFPIAERFYHREISLPMYPTLTWDEQNYIINKIRNFM